MTTPSSTQPDRAISADLHNSFIAAQTEDPALRHSELSMLIRRITGKRAILAGKFNGRRAIFRMFLDSDPDSPRREWDEMSRIWPHMRGGNLRIAEPYHFAPKHRLIVTEQIEGTPLLDLLHSLPPADRAGYLFAPAEWLRKYSLPSETTKSPKATAWLARAEKQASKQPHTELRDKESEIIQELKRIAPLANQQKWRFAICHGDFHPNNLILNPPRLTGIDLGGSSFLPIYKDIARFLMHMGRRGLIPSGKSRFGVDLEGFEAFSDVFKLDHWEREIALPYMLGIEALIRVENPNIGRSRVKRAAKMYDLLTPDLKTI